MSWLTENFREGSTILFNGQDVGVIVQIGRDPDVTDCALVLWLEDGTQQWVKEEAIMAVELVPVSETSDLPSLGDLEDVYARHLAGGTFSDRQLRERFRDAIEAAWSRRR